MQFPTKSNIMIRKNENYSSYLVFRYIETFKESRKNSEVSKCKRLNVLLGFFMEFVEKNM